MPNKITFFSIDQYRKVLYAIISFGLIVFVNGFLCFPEVSWVKSTFYLLILLPGLALIPAELRDFPYTDKILLSFIALPLYLCLSHLWANDDHVTRGFFFFVKQVIFIFIFIFCVWVAIRKHNRFLDSLLISVVATGSVFSLISILDFFINIDTHKMWSSPLLGFSTNDSNKAGSFFVIHASLCLHLLLFDKHPKKSGLAIKLIIASLFLDFFLIYLTHSKITWIILILTPIFYFLKYLKVKKQFFIALTILFLALLLFSQLGLWDIILSDKGAAIRLSMWRSIVNQVLENTWTGTGLTYKLGLAGENIPQLHSHNIFMDTLRFGGVFGLLLILVQITAIYKAYLGITKRKDFIPIIFWFSSGLILLSFYGQQPLTRPGYIWFLYWVPATMIISQYLNDTKTLSTTSANTQRLLS